MNSIKRNILLFGATGKTGEQISKELSSRNVKLSVFVREESAQKLKDNTLKIIHGDVLNFNDVEAAIKEESYTDIIISLGNKMLKNSVIRSKGTEHIVSALGSTQTKSKIHVISALGVGNSWSQLSGYGKLISKLMLKNVMEDHRLQEKLVMNSGNPYHILRPVGLKDGDPIGVVHLQLEGLLPSNTITRADVAKFLVDSLLEERDGLSSICQKK